MNKLASMTFASAFAFMAGATSANAASDAERSSEEAGMKTGTTQAAGTYTTRQFPPVPGERSLGYSGKIAHIFEESMADCSQQIARSDRNELGPSSMIECSMSPLYRALSILRHGIETSGMQTIYFGAMLTSDTNNAAKHKFLGRDLSRPFTWSKVDPNEMLRSYGLPCLVSLTDSGDRSHVQTWSGTCSWNTFTMHSVDHKIEPGNGIIVLTDSNKVVAIELVDP